MEDKEIVFAVVDTHKRKELEKYTLISEWCECQKPEYLCYPEDGECPCGIDHHHVHCVCGKIMQWG